MAAGPSAAKGRPRRIVLGVTGSIAAFKAPELVRALIRAGHEVRCVLTPNAAQFVTPLTLQTLSKSPVAQSLYDPSLWDMAHLTLADWADLILVAPCTADFLARAASGRAEGVLDGLLLAARAPVALCPAMDGGMWEHPATRANTAKVKSYGYKVWGPVKGELASGKIGMGRMLEPHEIAERCSAAS